MGTEKRFRNEYVPGTLEVAKTFTASSDATVAGALTVTGVQTLSGGSKDPVETVSSTATTASAYGISIIATTKAGTRTFKIGNPVAGNVKHVVVGSITGSSSKVNIRCSSTKPAIYGTTAPGAVRRSMNFASSGMGVTLIGISTGIYYVSVNVGGAYGSSFST